MQCYRNIRLHHNRQIQRLIHHPSKIDCLIPRLLIDKTKRITSLTDKTLIKQGVYHNLTTTQQTKRIRRSNNLRNIRTIIHRQCYTRQIRRSIIDTPSINRETPEKLYPRHRTSRVDHHASIRGTINKIISYSTTKITSEFGDILYILECCLLYIKII